MRLVTRLLLLILLCLAPMIATLVYTQYDLRQQRNVGLRTVALRQAELVNADLDSILAGARQLLTAVAESRQIAMAGPECNTRLTTLAHTLPGYAFLAVAAPDGRIVCASTPALLKAPAPAWLSSLSTGPFSSGVYSTQLGIPGGFLPLGVPFGASSAAGGGPEPGPALAIAALDLDWLGRHLEQAELGRTTLLRHWHSTVLDRAGTIIAHYPDTEAWLGKPGPDEMRALIDRTVPGVASIHGVDGVWLEAGYVPAIDAPAGLTAVAALSPSDLMGGLDRLAIPQAVLIAVSALLAMLVAILAAGRFILRPIGRLLGAAERWRDGDLTARAQLNDGAEFGALAASFNEMAAALELRDQERRTQAGLLEAQVIERTRALSETNNRLQVEMAERERSEVALQEGQQLQAVGQLAGGVAHDFNNLLATVLGCLELIGRRAGALPAAEQDRLNTLIQRASDAVQRGSQLTSRLLAFSRRQHLTPRPADLNLLVNDLLTLAGSTIGRRIRVSTDLAPDLWPALADPGQVEAALLNLCLNARDAMPEGGRLTIQTSNETISASDTDLEPGRYVRISVSDNGFGMSPEVLRRALDPFFTTKGPGASGLGLSQVYGLARQSGGTLRLRSTPGQGTEVSLLLPRARDATGTLPVVLGPDTLRRPALSLQVLLVDDDHAVRQVTADMLRHLGCTVLEAQGGREALGLLCDATPDLLVLDYAMPAMNGLELARAARQNGILSPVLLATGYAELSEDVAAAEALLDAVLRKPFTLRELHAVIARLMSQTRRESNVVLLRLPSHG